MGENDGHRKGLANLGNQSARRIVSADMKNVYRRKLLALTACSVVWLAACGSSDQTVSAGGTGSTSQSTTTTSTMPEELDLAAQLESAKRTWAQADVIDYVLTYQIQCFCPEIIRTVTVVGGEVTEVVDEGEPFGDLPALTVDDLFAELDQAVDGSAYSISATFDIELGYPRDYFIDEEELMVDEEHGIVVQRFEISARQ